MLECLRHQFGQKWNSIRDRIVQSSYDIACLQETKRDHFDLNFIRLFCPPCDCFEFLPSLGASRGSIILQKSSCLELLSSAHTVEFFQNSYATTVEFSSLHNGATQLLTNIYVPCTPSGKRDFLQWFQHIQMPDGIDWLVVGDFNPYRSPEDRNKLGADYAEMLLFNDAISMLGLVELPLKGKHYTWTNKQQSPLLGRLDWFFTSACWTLSYPHSYVTSMSMETSNHTPCLISINTAIPKGHIFCFENFWMQHEDFFSQVQTCWFSSVQHPDATKSITAKFKNLRKSLKDWSHTLSNLKETIDRVKLVIGFLNFLEEFRDLSLVEWNSELFWKIT